MYRNPLAPVVLLAALQLLQAAPALAAAFEGQVTCSQCWHEADRNRVPYGSADDLGCAKRCADGGVPPALAVKQDGSFELLLLEGRPGGENTTWLELMGRFVRVEGTSGEARGRKTLHVESVTRLEDSPWGGPARGEDPGDVHAGHDADEGATLAWTDLGGHRQSLESFHGRIVVLNFWATWCEPCRKEMPDLVKVQNRYGMHGVQVVGASADDPEQRDFVMAMARKLRVNFPIVLGATTAQMEALGLGVALPATVVLDRHGHVAQTFNGVVRPADLERALDALVAGESVSAAPTPEHTHTHVARGPGKTQASLVPS